MRTRTETTCAPRTQPHLVSKGVHAGRDTQLCRGRSRIQLVGAREKVNIFTRKANLDGKGRAAKIHVCVCVRERERERERESKREREREKERKRECVCVCPNLE